MLRLDVIHVAGVMAAAVPFFAAAWMKGVVDLEVLNIVGIGLLTVTAGWVIAAGAMANNDVARPRLLGVCWRLARRLDVPVRRIRFLVAMIAWVTGFLPVVILYLIEVLVL